MAKFTPKTHFPIARLIYIAYVERRHMVKIYASVIFAIDTKNDLKFIFQWNWPLSKMNEENVMHSAGHRKIINNIKHFVRILLKLPTKKISRKHTSKIAKDKNLSFMSSSL